ncbi:MAG: 3-deoxy-D-manno-octulosonic acid transferase, partial [Desulfobacterales bacterium]|nr:3-deoxy-D-manno-octulosonic acid transferase [Desulfobacterales bacterium]
STLVPADIWVQASSAGESYLAWELLKHFQPLSTAKILITSNTKQGMETLNRAVKDIQPNTKITAYTAYFPFDSPGLMKKAIESVRPKIIVLLESEIWPGFLFEAKQFGCNICILNGRMTAKSLKRYRIWPSLWRTLKPDTILAISKDDARRFKKLFKLDQVDVMPNIKYDRMDLPKTDSKTANIIQQIIPPDTSLVVLGSVRKEEENDVEKIIAELIKKQPHIVIGLFPRHLNRIQYWTKILTKHKTPWTLRSQINEPVTQATIIVWDTFGELHAAYNIARAVFVGGSLAPLGGQNFLEPLTCGVSPVIGPFWDNFSWVGSEIVTQKLVRIAKDWKEVADMLMFDITNPPLHEDITKKALKYLKDHQGGTTQAVNLINNFLK